MHASFYLLWVPEPDYIDKTAEERGKWRGKRTLLSPSHDFLSHFRQLFYFLFWLCNFGYILFQSLTLGKMFWCLVRTNLCSCYCWLLIALHILFAWSIWGRLIIMDECPIEFDCHRNKLKTFVAQTCVECTNFSSNL